MSDVTTEQLKKHISDILKDADLAAMSTKKVREQLEEKLKCNLNSRRGEIKDIVMDIVNSKESGDEDGSGSEESEEEAEEEDEAPQPKKRASTGRKPLPAKKKKKASSDEENSEADGDSGDADSDYGAKQKKVAPKGKNKGGRKKKGSDSDSDEDWKRAKPTGGKKYKKVKGKKRSTGFTRPYTLSSDLASVVGAESLPRYEVVKKIWALIKERNLYDPKNKQFAICDNELMKVIGVKRFRTFAMLKYLKPHFID